VENPTENDETKLLLNEIENLTTKIETAAEDEKKKYNPELKGSTIVLTIVSFF